VSTSSNDLIKFLRRVRNVREFTPQQIPDDVLNDILEVGRWSGSASNRQPVEVVIVRDAAARQKLVESGSNTAGNAQVSLVLTTSGDPARHDLETYDEGRTSERLLIAATALGIGAGITTLKGNGPEATKQILGIPAERRVYSVINLGYADQAAIAAKPKVPQPRKPMSEFAHWERW
jgi:nitroreductase